MSLSAFLFIAAAPAAPSGDAGSLPALAKGGDVFATALIWESDDSDLSAPTGDAFSWRIASAFENLDTPRRRSPVEHAGPLGLTDLVLLPWPVNHGAEGLSTRFGDFDYPGFSPLTDGEAASVNATEGETSRMPRARPDRDPRPSVTRRRARTLLAYAPDPGETDAPFDALINSPAANPAEDVEGRGPVAWAHDLSSAGLLGRFIRNTRDAAADLPLPASVWEADEQRCLAEAIYFEARGEPEVGQIAVAQIVLNRVGSSDYPDTICGVVYQDQAMRDQCQFSFACDGIANRVDSARDWRSARRIARQATAGSNRLADLSGATNYHADYVTPYWAKDMNLVARIGAHLFYRVRSEG